jgi:hypothetical protein
MFKTGGWNVAQVVEQGPESKTQYQKKKKKIKPGI